MLDRGYHKLISVGVSTSYVISLSSLDLVCPVGLSVWCTFDGIHDPKLPLFGCSTFTVVGPGVHCLQTVVCNSVHQTNMDEIACRHTP